MSLEAMQSAMARRGWHQGAGSGGAICAGAQV